MSLSKAILNKKEHRKEYRGAKAIDKTCRNHGGCPCCEENRIHKYKKKEDSLKEKENDYLNKEPYERE